MKYLCYYTTQNISCELTIQVSEDSAQVVEILVQPESCLCIT